MYFQESTDKRNTVYSKTDFIDLLLFETTPPLSIAYNPKHRNEASIIEVYYAIEETPSIFCIIIIVSRCTLRAGALVVVAMVKQGEE